MQTTTIICDVTGKDLSYRETVDMTSINILYNEVVSRDVKQEDGSLKKQNVVLNQERYAFHICHEHSKDFMKYINEFFTNKKKELAKPAKKIKKGKK